jgi:hypothetical protein
VAGESQVPRRVTLCVRSFAGNSIEEESAARPLLDALQVNYTIRRMLVMGSVGAAELACHYRVPHVRLVARTRVMCQAGRASAADAVAARCSIVAWLCERAPLWVVVRVCALLRNAT